MIIDVTGITLIPSNCGNDCPGSWEYAGLDCCCDECDYIMCCQDTHDPTECRVCSDQNCPHSPNCSENT